MIKVNDGEIEISGDLGKICSELCHMVIRTCSFKNLPEEAVEKIQESIITGLFLGQLDEDVQNELLTDPKQSIILATLVKESATAIRKFKDIHTLT